MKTLPPTRVCLLLMIRVGQRGGDSARKASRTRRRHFAWLRPELPTRASCNLGSNLYTVCDTPGAGGRTFLGLIRFAVRRSSCGKGKEKNLKSKLLGS